MFGPLGHGRYKEYARDVHGAGKHLLALINDILDLSKAAAGKFELACEEIAPAVFTLLDDGLAYVKEGTKVFSEPGAQETDRSEVCGRRPFPPRSAALRLLFARLPARSPPRSPTLRLLFARLPVSPSSRMRVHAADFCSTKAIRLPW